MGTMKRRLLRKLGISNPENVSMVTVADGVSEGLRKGSDRVGGLKEMPKVGDKLRFIGDAEDYGDITFGRLYEVESSGRIEAVVHDNAGRKRFIGVGNPRFELAEDLPTVHDLIANLGRRLHEVEQLIVPKEYAEADDVDLPALYPKYFKDVSDITSIDVYKTHELFDIDDPSGAIQHASKKLLLSGARTGGKSKFTDIKEARDTLNRWLEINALQEEASE